MIDGKRRKVYSDKISDILIEILRETGDSGIAVALLFSGIETIIRINIQKEEWDAVVAIIHQINKLDEYINEIDVPVEKCGSVVMI